MNVRSLSLGIVGPEQPVRPINVDEFLSDLVQVLHERGLLAYFPCQGKWFGVEDSSLVLESLPSPVCRLQFDAVIKSLGMAFKERHVWFNWCWTLEPVFRWEPKSRLSGPQIKRPGTRLSLVPALEHRFAAGYALNYFEPQGLKRLRTSVLRRSSLGQDYSTIANIVCQFPPVTSLHDKSYFPEGTDL
jgi:hypothetical protein